MAKSELALRTGSFVPLYELVLLINLKYLFRFAIYFLISHVLQE